MNVKPGCTAMKPPSFPDSHLVSVPSSYGFVETTERFKAALKERDLHLFALIDHANEARKVGLELRPTRLLIFGNPKGGTLLMQSKQEIGLDLPLRVLLWEDANEKTWIGYHPVPILARSYDVSDRGEAVTRLSEGLVALVKAVSTSPHVPIS